MSAERQLNIGIIGAARVASYAMIEPARSVPGVQVVAVASRDPARAEAFAAEHGVPRVAESYEALYADPEIDLVYIATPPAMHPPQALGAIAAGKPVLVEKPFADTSEAARRVLDAGRAAGVAVFEAMHSPHHRLFGRILELVRGGEIGAVRRLTAEFSVRIDPDDPIRWRAELGGGALMDLGVYPLAWVRRIAGEAFDVTRSAAVMRGGVDESFAAELAFAGGVSAEVRGSMATDNRAISLRIEGDSGVIDVANPLAPQMGHRVSVSTGGESRSERLDGPSSFEAQLAAVRDTLVSGAAFPFPPDDPRLSMEAIERVRGGWAR